MKQKCTDVIKDIKTVEVVNMAIRGDSTKEIAQELGISVETVRKHLKSPKALSYVEELPVPWNMV